MSDQEKTPFKSFDDACAQYGKLVKQATNVHPDDDRLLKAPDDYVQGDYAVCPACCGGGRVPGPDGEGTCPLCLGGGVATLEEAQDYMDKLDEAMADWDEHRP